MAERKAVMERKAVVERSRSGESTKQREHESGAFAVVREGGGGATQRSRWFAKATAASKSVRGGTR